jgi:hypothetical protein
MLKTADATGLAQWLYDLPDPNAASDEIRYSYNTLVNGIWSPNLIVSNFTNSGKPSFASLWNNYPGDTYSSEDVYKMIGGKVYQNFQANPEAYANSCALRLSDALNKSGNKIPFIKGQTGSGQNGDWYFYKVSDLANYLKSLFGSPDISGTTQDAFNGKQGIIWFQVSGWGDATGHFTLWNGSQVAHGDYFDQAFKVSLWILK